MLKMIALETKNMGGSLCSVTVEAHWPAMSTQVASSEDCALKKLAETKKEY